MSLKALVVDITTLEPIEADELGVNASVPKRSRTRENALGDDVEVEKRAESSIAESIALQDSGTDRRSRDHHRAGQAAPGIASAPTSTSMTSIRCLAA